MSSEAAQTIAAVLADASVRAAVAAALHRRDAKDSAVVDFLTAAEGVEVVDSTDLDFDQTIDAVIAVIERCAPEAQRGADHG